MAVTASAVAFDLHRSAALRKAGEISKARIERVDACYAASWSLLLAFEQICIDHRAASPETDGLPSLRGNVHA
jgi:hypothetical protein